MFIWIAVQPMDRLSPTYLCVMSTKQPLRLFFLVIIYGVLESCNGGHPNEESKKDHTTGSGVTGKASDSVTAKAAVGALIAHYLHIKDGLGNNDSRFASQGAQALVADLKHLDRSRFSEIENNMLDRVYEQMTDMATHIRDNPNEIVHQREHFRQLSQSAYVLVTSFGYVHPLFVYRMPHKEDEREVLWLSEAKSENSPYTGAHAVITSEPEVLKQP
ncbi:MAG: DUF3347 domain-containing protein [Sphingobacteriales bacterium]|nr:MAG: DUF3347 domain-containing protein [Sphingobacteriales bacterium]